MKPTRRQMLSGLSAMALAPGCKKVSVDAADTGLDGPVPAPLRSPEPEKLWNPDGELATDVFPSGVQVGDAGPSSAVVSVWVNADEVTVLLAKAVEAEWIPVGDEVTVTRVGASAQCLVEGLDADSAYCVVAFSGTQRSAVSRFRTALGPDGFRQVTIGATSCLHSNQPWLNMSHVAATRPDLFMLLGDTVYADSASTVEGYRAYWSEALNTQGLIDVSGATSLVATWDDHEVFNDLEGLNAPPERVEAALTAFREAIPQRQGLDGGIWRKLSWGETADIFVLDGRGERDGAEQYLSDEQMEWLKSGLEESTARFKLVMNSVPITDFGAIFGEVLMADRWQGYPKQRGEIIDHIVGNAIEGVLWITGDFHFCTASRIDIPDGPAMDQWEVMVGPGGSTLNFAANLLEPSEQFPVIFAEWSSTLIHLDPGTGTVRVEWVGDSGEIWEQFELTI